MNLLFMWNCVLIIFFIWSQLYDVPVIGDESIDVFINIPILGPYQRYEAKKIAQPLQATERTKTMHFVPSFYCSELQCYVAHHHVCHSYDTDNKWSKDIKWITYSFIEDNNYIINNWSGNDDNNIAKSKRAWTSLFSQCLSHLRIILIDLFGKLSLTIVNNFPFW